MSNIVHTYDGTPLTIHIPATSMSIPSRAELGNPSMGGVSPEDPTAALTMLGHRPYIIEELDCAQPRLFTGWVGERNIGRSPEQTQIAGPDARIHDTTLLDLNALFGFRIINLADGSRPSETIADRLAWLLNSQFLQPLIIDTGYVDWGIALTMDACDYRGGYPRDVLDDLSTRSATLINYYAFWDADAPGVSLYFDYLGEGPPYCPLSISNVIGEQSGSVYAPIVRSRLKRSPETVYSDVIVEFNGGSIYRYAATTAALHIRRGTKISRPYTSSEATAIEQGDYFLNAHGTESDVITTQILVPASDVGLIRAGQQMVVKFSDFPGYSTNQNMRIITCDPKPVDDYAALYNVGLELTRPRPEQEQDT